MFKPSFKNKFNSGFKPKFSGGSSGGTPPPSGSVLVVEDFSAQVGDPDSSGYSLSANIGSLTPAVLVDGNQVGTIASLVNPNKVVLIMVDNATSGSISASFAGTSYIFDFNAGFQAYQTDSDALYDFLLANRGANIQFTAVSI